MSFNIKLYNNGSEGNVLNKNITLITTISGVLKENCSILKPSILIQGDLSTFNKCNYAVIDAFNRSYYISDIVSETNNLIRLDMDVDVLYTYRTDILKLTGMLARSESNGNNYVADSAVVSQIGSPSEIINYDPVDDYCFILAVTGSGEDETETTNEQSENSSTVDD